MVKVGQKGHRELISLVSTAENESARGRSVNRDQAVV